MKYYAVTDDPRELFHYGVKGMKWGQHLFGDDLKPKSSAYKRAASKLRASARTSTQKMSSKQKATPKKMTVLQKAFNSRISQDERYQKAVQKSQKQTNTLNALYKQDQANAIQKDLDRQQKMVDLSRKMMQAQAKNDLKAMKKAYKAEKKMPKLMQEAREGRLRYGGLSEEQISRLQNRLSMEENARRLGGKEKASYRLRKKEARQEGKLEGIKRGTAAAMEEVAKAGTQYGIHLLNQAKLRSKAVGEGRNQRAKNRIVNKKTGRDLRREAREEAYKELIKDPDSALIQDRLGARIFTRKAARTLKGKEQKRLAEAGKQLNDDIYRKWLLGGKNDNYESIKKRLEERDDVYKLIYGEENQNKNPSGKTSKPKKKERGNPFFDGYDDDTSYSLLGGARNKYDQVRDNTYEHLDAVQKSINRKRKRLERIMNSRKNKNLPDVIID